MIASASSAAPAESLAAPLRWSEEPDHLWTFTGWSAAPSLRVNYIAAGPEDGQPFLLIHGFGASGFHWRRRAPPYISISLPVSPSAPPASIGGGA